ncbi:hypothetical protein DICPUDRAFT_39824 [Dictyostelium purpureum]|uniref:TRAF-type domain-containing protein n=1 Tax=Dictyostelium purpureum TaxID=5786 RepID=F0ZX18_DICPU|nr:uncharacterized protein DICPUDRAFT_39824 [Dictyostelium purpureum]EGC31507.1 hypothetical protein DICPUDRAFT_39824 [Dictyostelium purpureum]|eukprot:XP_003291959.1 hypothetical protein DICPUDRAFT_39824 [Dictyostelium purpureum]
MSREPIKYNVSELSYEFDDDYVCPICFDIYYKKEVYQCKEGHCSCKDCWIKSLKNKKECMQCKTKVNSFNELSRVRQVEKFLLKICVCCPYSFKNIIRVYESEKLIKDGGGCNEIIKLEELDNHIENCSFRFIKCKYHEKGCNDKIRYNENETHISKCEYRPIICPHCSNVYLLKTIEQHYLECPSMLIGCKECNKKIKRGEMGNHLDKECQEVIIPCKFSQFGCNDKIKRRNLENHLEQTNHTKHLSTAIEHLMIKNDHIKHLSAAIEHLNIKNDQQSNMIEELVIKNNLLTNSINELAICREYKYKWIISNYSKINHNVGDTLISPKFGYPNLFEIRLSKNDVCVGKLSVFIYSSIEQKNMSFSITLLNKDTKKNKIQTLNNIEILESQGRGWSNFIKSDEMNKENGYVTENDKVEFEFTLTYPKPMPLLS